MYVGDLPPGSYLGELDPKTTGLLRKPASAGMSRSQSSENSSSHLSLCVRADDFEGAARRVLDRRAWIYISSSANAGLSLQVNLDDWKRISFRPRVMRNVENISMESSILGHTTMHPFFVSAMGTLGVGHTGAEPELVRAVARKGLHCVISTASTRTAGQIMREFEAERRRLGGASPSELFFQFYIPPERSGALQIIETARSAGYRGLWITVDLPVLGKRTADKRLQAEEALALEDGEDSAPPAAETGATEGEKEEENPFTPGVGGRVMAGRVSARTTWEDLGWIRKAWQGPIVIKGIQSVEDAKLAMEYGCQGVVLSNHGGRQLHTAPSSLMTLLEIRTYCPEVLEKLEVYVDGGLRDGADVLKAICLGAKSVGVGRPFFYALAAYGAAGVERCADSKFTFFFLPRLTSVEWRLAPLGRLITCVSQFLPRSWQLP